MSRAIKIIKSSKGATLLMVLALLSISMPALFIGMSNTKQAVIRSMICKLIILHILGLKQLIQPFSLTLQKEIC